MSDAQTLPHSLEAEQAVLCAAMWSASAADQAGELAPDDFYRSSHAAVFSAIRRLRSSGVKPGPVEVLDELRRTGDLDTVGGPTAVTDLATLSAVPSNVGHYIGIVRDRARRRRIHHAASGLAGRIHDLDVDLDATVDTAVQTMLERGHDGDGIVTLDDIYHLVAERVAAAEDEKPAGIDIGWEPVDRRYRVVPGKVTVVTGTPGSGKSQWLDCALVKLAGRHGWKFGIYSPEQAPVDEHAYRLAWSKLGRTPKKLADYGNPDAVDEALTWVGDHFVWIDSNDEISVPALLARARTIKARHGLDGLVIDPWNTIAHDSRDWHRDDLYIRDMLSRIVAFARSTGIHIWVVAHPRQMDPETPGSTRLRAPTVYHIAGGAEWANKADTVICVWRDQQGEKDPPEQVKVIVQKARKTMATGGWATVGTSTVWFDAARLTYLSHRPNASPV